MNFSELQDRVKTTVARGIGTSRELRPAAERLIRARLGRLLPCKKRRLLPNNEPTQIRVGLEKNTTLIQIREYRCMCLAYTPK